MEDVKFLIKKKWAKDLGIYHFGVPIPELNRKLFYKFANTPIDELTNEQIEWAQWFLNNCDLSIYKPFYVGTDFNSEKFKPKETIKSEFTNSRKLLLLKRRKKE